MRIADSGHSIEADKQEEDTVDSEPGDIDDLASVEYVEGSTGLLTNQITATLVRRYKMVTRQLKSYVVQQAIPLILLGLGFYVKKFAEDASLPIPKDPNRVSIDTVFTQAMEQVVMVLFVSFAFSSIGSNITALVIKERKTNSNSTTMAEWNLPR